MCDLFPTKAQVACVNAPLNLAVCVSITQFKKTGSFNSYSKPRVRFGQPRLRLGKYDNHMRSYEKFLISPAKVLYYSQLFYVIIRAIQRSSQNELSDIELFNSIDSGRSMVYNIIYSTIGKTLFIQTFQIIPRVFQKSP